MLTTNRIRILLSQSHCRLLPTKAPITALAANTTTFPMTLSCHDDHHHHRRHRGHHEYHRWLSSSSSSSNPMPTTNNPPPEMTQEIAFGIQNTNELFLHHGIAQRKLQALAKSAGNVQTLVSRWQQMMETFLSTQVHVLAGLGYPPSEVGLETYHRQIATFLHHADPQTTEELRKKTRDLWRHVLATAFHIPLHNQELSIVDARSIMHKVSLKMQSPNVLEYISKKCAALPSTGDRNQDFANKHQIVQETLVHQVYLDGTPSLVEECGFESGEKGYVMMQCVMAEHQNDPLIGQYIGTAMMKVLQSAGVDLSTMQSSK